MTNLCELTPISEFSKSEMTRSNNLSLDINDSICNQIVTNSFMPDQSSLIKRRDLEKEEIKMEGVNKFIFTSMDDMAKLSSKIENLRYQQQNEISPSSDFDSLNEPSIKNYFKPFKSVHIGKNQSPNNRFINVGNEMFNYP